MNSEGKARSFLCLCWAFIAPAPNDHPREVSHDLYICAALGGPFYIGSRIEEKNGIMRSADREKLEHVGFDHPRIDAIAVPPGKSRELFAAASNGLLHTTDDGATWRIMTGWDMTELKSVVIDRHAPENVYVALPDGIGVSRDGGRTWSRGESGIRRKYTQALASDSTQAGRLVAGTELGIYLTEDSARSWVLVQPTDATVDDVKQSPHDARVFVAVTQGNGAWRSTDGAHTWRQIAGIDSSHTLHVCDFDPTQPGRMVVCGWGCGVLVSEDDGKTWESRNTGLPNANVWCVACDPDFPGRLYAAPHQSPVFVSDDFGVTWRKAWFESATVRRFVFVPRTEDRRADR